MQHTVRLVGGGEMAVKDNLKFTDGDIIHKNKHHNTLVYFITDVAKRGEYVKYKFFRYDGEIFENHDGSGWRRADYLDKRVETAGGEEEWIDYDMGSFDHIGHITENEALISIGGDTYYTISLEKVNRLRSNGFKEIKDAWLFYETVGSQRYVVVHNAGWKTDGLADDMFRLSYGDEDAKFVEHEQNVMEAVNRGIWIPIKPTDSKIDGHKETRI